MDDDDILTGGDSDEGESLSDTIATALEDQEGENLISELGDAQDAAGETQETDGQALPDDEGGTETPDHGGTDQIDEGEPPSDQAQEETDTEPEREPDTGAADQYRQLGEIYSDTVAPYQEHLASRGMAPAQVVRVLLEADRQLSTGTPERKAQILAQMAHEYGVSLANIEDVEPVNPELAQLHQRLGGIERVIQGQRQQGEAQVRRSVEAEVTAFEKEKDTAGNLLRPHLEKVRTVMGRILGEDPKLTLQEAYDSAVLGDPKFRKAPVKQRAAPATKHSKPGKPKKAKPAKAQSLYDTVVDAHRSAVERANA